MRPYFVGDCAAKIAQFRLTFLQRFEITGFAVRDGQHAAQNLQSFFSLGLDR
jgi:hypothetical protein